MGHHVVVAAAVFKPPTPVRARATVLGWAGAAALLASLATMGPAALAAPAAPAHNRLPGYDPSVIGLVLSGQLTTLVPPKEPTVWPPRGSAGKDVRLATGHCAAIFDGGFSGSCAVASGPGGTVVGVVEHEAGLEFDLVWARHGQHWDLALRREFEQPRRLTEVRSAPLGASGQPELVFVTPSASPGFSRELDVVGEDGQVALYHYLGGGFTVLTAPGELALYVPVSAEESGPKGYYDQVLVSDIAGLWTVVAQQYVPAGAALAQHHGGFSMVPLLYRP